MSIAAPIVDARYEVDVLRAIHRRAPGYAPEWSPQPGAPDAAIAQIFARFAGLIHDGLHEVPRRGYLTFLDMLGARLLPAESARVPLVFTIMENATIDPTLLANSQVAAVVSLPAPSPLEDTDVPAPKPQEILFSTEKEITLARSQLKSFYSLAPGTDEYADHTGMLDHGFAIFGDMRSTEHAIYFGHDQLFALAANADVPAEIRLSFQLAPGKAALSKLDIRWEYLSKDGWLPLDLDRPDDGNAQAKDGDGTEGLTHNGQIVLRKICGPDAKEETIFGHTSYWVRGVLETPLPVGGRDDTVALPTVDNVRASVRFVKSDLQAEAAATDAFRLDISNNFNPFGIQPARYTTFYLASKEVFQRVGARVRINIAFSEPGKSGSEAGEPLELAFEYFDGKQWRSIEQSEFVDGTNKFTNNGEISFRCPPDWAESKVAGTSNYWLRIRIDQGDFGHPLQLKVETIDGEISVTADESTLRPPVIAGLRLQYAYQTDAELLDHCLAFNDFAFADYTQACRWPRRTFEPFQPIEDRQPSVHLGFDRPLPPALVSMFVAIISENEDAVTTPGTPAYIWEFLSEIGWRELGVLDETLGFSRSGMIQFIGPADAVPALGQGGSLYRIRARLKLGERMTTTQVRGIWMNAVWATHRLLIKADELGTSDGNPGQMFHVRPGRAPILEGETIEVREWAGRGRGWETAVSGVAASDLRFDRDPASGAITAVWVRWHERPNLFSTRASDRHYVIERALGSVRFGKGIPPAGSRIVASFATGGGIHGNVPAEVVHELRSAVPFLKGVSNPVPALGGAPVESLDAMPPRGAHRLRHRDRGISQDDIEWLAREASPAVARARCLPVTGPRGRIERGWITVLVLPHSIENRPIPTDELRRRVREYLVARMPASVGNRVRVLIPMYLPVGVMADIVPRVPQEAARVEARVRQRLDRFLHPLTGGSDGRGWPFGESLHVSQIAALLKQTTGVDYVLEIALRAGDTLLEDVVSIDPNTVIAAGSHELKLTIAER